jgi:tetratricopeptide (TPR) repeat protein
MSLSRSVPLFASLATALTLGGAGLAQTSGAPSAVSSPKLAGIELFHCGRFAEAEKLFVTALPRDSALQITADNADTLRWQGDTYYREGKFSDAHKVLSQEMSMEEKLYGTTATNVAETLDHLALVAIADGDTNRGLQEADGAMYLAQKKVSEQPGLMAHTLSICALAHLKQGRVAEALENAEKAKSIAESIAATSHADRTEALYVLALSQWRKGDLGSAKTSLKQADSIAATIFSGTEVTQFETSSGLALIELALGDKDSANKHYSQALNTARNLAGDKSDAVNELKQLYIKAMWDANHWIDALQLRSQEGDVQKVNANALGLHFTILKETAISRIPADASQQKLTSSQLAFWLAALTLPVVAIAFMLWSPQLLFDIPGGSGLMEFLGRDRPGSRNNYNNQPLPKQPVGSAPRRPDKPTNSKLGLKAQKSQNNWGNKR